MVCPKKREELRVSGEDVGEGMQREGDEAGKKGMVDEP